MEPFEQLALRADAFISAYTKYAGSLMAYALDVETMRRDPTYNGIRASRLAGKTLGIAIFAPSVARDSLRSSIMTQRFRGILGDCFPAAEFDEGELYRVAVAIVEEEPQA